MRLRVQYTAQLRTAIGRSEEEIELPEGSSLYDLIALLASDRHRETAPFLLRPGGEMQPSLLVTVNTRAVPAGEARSMRISAGDVVMLMPPIAGG